MWEKSHVLTLSVYKQTKAFPKEDRRAAASIPANLAEGCGRGSDAELARFAQISMGSASELEYHILLAKDLHYFEVPTFNQLNQDVVEIKKMLTSFIQKLMAES